MKKIILLLTVLMLTWTVSADMEFRSSSQIDVYSSFNMNNNIISNVGDPQDDSDALTEGYANQLYLMRSGDSIDGNLDMQGNRILNVPSPSNGTDAVNKNYVDNEVSTASGVQTLSEVLEEGSTANQSINMDSNRIRNLPSPDASGDAVPESYTLNFLNRSSGDSINGSIDMLDHDIKNVADPDSAQDAATKSYVDSELSSSTGNLSQVLDKGNSAEGKNINMSGGNITSGSSEMCLGDSC